MDVGGTNGWRFDEVVAASEVIAIVDRKYPLEVIEPNYHGEVARRYRYKDGGGEIGVIASVTQAFCADCTRARLSAKGSLYTCLFATRGTDLRQYLRNGTGDNEIEEIISSIWSQRNDRYSEIRSQETARVSKVEMSYIGG
jgi:cyclic pyranopterin phosphate synthase